MAKIFIEGGKSGIEELFNGFFQYVEGGHDKDGTPGFHISCGNEVGRSATIYMSFDNQEEFEEFLKSLREQIPEKKKE